MLKKVTTYSLYILLLAIFGLYFHFTRRVVQNGREGEICSVIKVRILDSAENRFVSRKEVNDLIVTSGINPLKKKRDEVDLAGLERLLEGKSAIRRSDISLNRKGELNVDITQRRPVLRIETPQGGYYIDEERYIFPLVSTFTSYVPVVTGAIPIKIESGYRGYRSGEEERWIENITALGNKISVHPLWGPLIQQIDILKNGDIVLYCSIGDQKIIFGGFKDIDYKFAKLNTYYHEIIPLYGWEKYSEVNLKYSDQIICSRRQNDKKSNIIR